ncbi:hypothetical protein JCM14469_00140 [Desulfatiferula olefinivorans]
MKTVTRSVFVYALLPLLAGSLMLSACGSSGGGGGGAQPVVTKLWYEDSDGDGFGNPDASVNRESLPDGYVANTFDCDDTDGDIHPMANELLGDGIDNNCNGAVDELSSPGIVPDTHQTTSYTTTFGEDADYSIDPPSYTKLDINGQALDDSAPGWAMVRDNVTGLVWELKNTADGTPNPVNVHDADNRYSREQARAVIEAMNDAVYGTFSDWRLPTIKELCLLADSSRFEPCISQTYFPLADSSDYLWSSIDYAPDTAKAWVFSIPSKYHLFLDKTSARSFWAVRGTEHSSVTEEAGSGIVIDTTTGLMWQVATVTGTDGDGMTFDEALAHCEAMTLGGFNDWRLPSRNEMISLVDFDRHEPALDPALFPGTKAGETDYYWTSTTAVLNNNETKHAWSLKFMTGVSSYSEKTKKAWVRAVRGGNNTTVRAWYRDGDADGYGDAGVIRMIDASAPGPVGYVDNDQDCDDTDISVSPAAPDLPDDGIDQNCTGIDTVTWYRDADGDGYGDMGQTIFAEAPTAGYVHNQAHIDAGDFDCDDANVAINPGRVDLADDGIDNDCNGLRNVSWYADLDGDGYGDGDRVAVSETAPEGGTFALNDLDCDDDDDSVRPGLVEIIGDGIDTNCNGDIDDDALAVTPDTGQTGDYTAVAGEDSDYTVNPQSFTKIAADGTPLDPASADWAVVRDNVTGLYWEVKTAENTVSMYNYANGYTYAYDLQLGGFSDWRLPTLTELASIAHLGTSAPAINTTFFPNTQSKRYWTRSGTGDANQALVLSFQNGVSYVGTKTDALYVRAVRGGVGAGQLVRDNGDETLTDRLTGLTWTLTSLGSGTWDESLARCEVFDHGGYTDWRLPSADDAQSLIDLFNTHESITFSTFFGEALIAGRCWTQTLSETDSTKAYYYSFLNGTVSDQAKTQDAGALAVRGARLGRFIDNGDGTVFDNRTGLMWTLANGNGGVPLTFEESLVACRDLIVAGHEDWRLPSRSEMLSLLEASMDETTNYLAVFGEPDDIYWTSTSAAGPDLEQNAWQINFSADGISITLGDYFNTNLFRAVRGGNIQ